MYLVELRPGKEELYRTGDDLAAAIRRGDVDVHSRIYHRATSKWISITLHPQYKAIVAQKTAEPLPPLERSTWTYLNAQSETLAGADSEHDGSSADPASGGAPAVERAMPPWRRLFALSVAGLALLFGMQLAFSGPRPPWSRPGSAPTPVLPASVQQEEAPRRDEQVISLASTSTAWSQPEAETEPAPAPEAKPASLPRAPRLRMKTLGDVLPDAAGAKKRGTPAARRPAERLTQRYAAAYDSVRARLGSGVRVARLDQLLAPSRLTPDGGVTETRLGLAGVANFIRVYRQQEAAIEREFQDSVTVMSKVKGWTTLREPPALASLSSHLLAGIDSVLGVLDDQAGAYKLGEGTILFEDGAASRRYGELRRHVGSLVNSARAAGGEESEGPIGYLLQAIGTTSLPREI
jgi:hypothetical protein